MPDTDASVHVLRGSLPAAAQVTQLKLSFGRTRTTIREVRLYLDDDEPRILDLEGFQAVWNVDPMAGRVGGEVRVEVDYSGEPPQPLAVTIDDKQGIPIPTWASDDCVPCQYPGLRVLERLWRLERERFSVPVSVTDTPAATTPSAKVFAMRGESIDRVHRIQTAMTELDQKSNVASVSNAVWADINALLDQLEYRIDLYTGLGKSGCKYLERDLPVANLLRLKATSIEFQDVFDALHAQEPAGTPEEPQMSAPELFDWTFELFVCGNLVTRHKVPAWQRALLGHGSPNSPLFLDFAMFAIVCIEEGVSPDWWRERLRTLVRCAHIFLESACPMIDAPYPSPKDCYNFFPDRYFPYSRREELQTEYQSSVGAGGTADEQFLALRGRLASLCALAFDGGIESSGPYIDIPSDAFATLKAQGVGDPVTHEPCS